MIDAEQRAAPGRPLALQRRRDRPPAGRRRPRPLRPRRARSSASWQRGGRPRPRRRARAVGARARTTPAPTADATRASGFFARVRVEDYGPGRIRPHERTHPGPKEDRLRLTRATRANLSPIFSLYDDPDGAAWSALAPHTESVPWGEVTDDDGTAAPPLAGRRRRRDRAPSPTRCADAELLIADGHHRYETARVYADEIGGEGDAPLRAHVPRRARRTRASPSSPPTACSTGLDPTTSSEALRDGDHARLRDRAEVDADALEPDRRRRRAASASATSTPTSSARCG